MASRLVQRCVTTTAPAQNGAVAHTGVERASKGRGPSPDMAPTTAGSGTNLLVFCRASGDEERSLVEILPMMAIRQNTATMERWVGPWKQGQADGQQHDRREQRAFAKRFTSCPIRPPCTRSGRRQRPRTSGRPVEAVSECRCSAKSVNVLSIIPNAVVRRR